MVAIENVSVKLLKTTTVAGKIKKEGDEITVTKAKAEILKSHGFIEDKETK